MDLVGGNLQGGGGVLFVLHVVVGVILSPLVQLDVAICGLVGGGGGGGALAFLLGSVCVGFGSGLCRRVVGVPVGAGCAPLVVGLFLFCCGGGDCAVSFG